MTRFSLKGVALAGAIIWGGAILLVGLINLASPAYGSSFLQIARSIYPGFHNSHTIGSVVIGTLYGLVDGAIGALLFAWLYNSFAGTGTQTHAS